MFKRLKGLCFALLWLVSLLALLAWLVAIGAAAALIGFGLVAATTGYLIGNVVYHCPGLFRHAWPHGGAVGAYITLAGLHYLTGQEHLVTCLYMVLALAHAVTFRRHLWGGFIHPLCDTWAKHCPCSRVLRLGRRVLGWMVGVVGGR